MSMKVRCKFRCESLTVSKSGTQVELVAVTSGSPENQSFFKYTPYGTMKFGTINDEAAAQFVPGNEYYIDITKVEG